MMSLQVLKSLFTVYTILQECYPHSLLTQLIAMRGNYIAALYKYVALKQLGTS